MPFYVRWTAPEVEMEPGVAEEWTEVGSDGVVMRELSFDEAGRIVFQSPSDFFKDGKDGRWRDARVGVDGRVNSVDPTEFERKWDQAVQETRRRDDDPGWATASPGKRAVGLAFGLIVMLGLLLIILVVDLFLVGRLG